MLAPNRHSCHALHAEVLIVEFPKAEKLVNNRLLLASTGQLWDVTRIFDDAVDIEVHAKAVRNTKENVQ